MFKIASDFNNFSIENDKLFFNIIGSKKYFSLGIARPLIHAIPDGQKPSPNLPLGVFVKDGFDHKYFFLFRFRSKLRNVFLLEKYIHIAQILISFNKCFSICHGEVSGCHVVRR